MRIYGSRQHGAWVLRLVGPLALGNGQGDFRAAIDEALAQGGRRIVVDLSRVAYADAAGIGELLRAQRRVSGRGGQLVLVELPRRVDELIDLYGLRRSLLIAGTVEDAWKGLEARPAPAARRPTIRSEGPGIIRRTTEGPWRVTPIPG